MTHEEYLEAKRIRDYYHEIVCDYQSELDRKRESLKKEWFEENLPKGKLITFTGGSFTKLLKRNEQYQIVSFAKPSNSICWWISVRNEKGTITKLPDYCFSEAREFNKIYDEITNN